MRAASATDGRDVQLERLRRVSSRRELNARRARLHELDVSDAEIELREAVFASPIDYLSGRGLADAPSARSFS